MVVSASFPFPSERFDIVYSGSVVHVIREDAELFEYLGNALCALKPGGLFFGSTLGLAEGFARRGREGPPRLMPEKEIRDYLSAAGFGSIVIQCEEIPIQRNHPAHLTLFQFSAIAE